MERYQMFTYSWHIDASIDDSTIFRVYGLDKNNQNVCIRVTGFTPYVYLELPSRIKWDQCRAQALGDRLDQLMPNDKAITKKLVMKHKLYGAHIDSEGKKKLFPYLLCTFATKKDIESLSYKIRYNIQVGSGIGVIRLKIHEQIADPILQFSSCRKLPTAGWMEFSGMRVQKDDQLTLCDHEFTINWKNTKPFDCEVLAKPLIMAYDIEANSSNPARMPKSSEAGDKIFQVSCVFCRYGDKPDKWEPYLLTLGNPDPKIVNKRGVATILTFKTEGELLVGFTNLVNERNPNLMAGFNLLGFDIQYMVERAQYTMEFNSFNVQGFHRFAHSPECTTSWSSAAFANQEYLYLDTEGRITIDLLPLVKRDFGKLDNYKLETISKFFFGKEHKKDPLNHKAIFKCYAMGTKKNSDGSYGTRARAYMAICGAYCIQDSILVLRLMDTLETWVGLSEMATTCNIPIFPLYTEGQQVRVYSQIYKFCMYNNTVVEKDGYIPGENERYMGAYVFEPVPGCYDDIVPLDFKSLYPSLIIAYNIDYTTLVMNGDTSISDDKCHVMEWEDHSRCEHDPLIQEMKKISDYIDKERVKSRAIRAQRDKLKVVDFLPDLAGTTPDDRKLMKKQASIDKQNECQRLTIEARRIERAFKPQADIRKDLKSRVKEHFMCDKRSYRWLKEPKGILPTILENLLDARARTRKRQKEIKGTMLGNEHLEMLYKVLEQRQLSVKICANSVYGALGVRSARYLPLMPAAMCTTYMGRVNIKLAAKVIIEQYRGDIVYGDTDSCLVHFPHCKTPQETWDYAEYVATEVTKIYPKPLVLEFEEMIYKRYLILKKKQYVYTVSNREGVVEDKIGKKGVILARRDNCTFVRNIYQNAIQMIFDKKNRDDIIYYVLTEARKIFAREVPLQDLVITQSIKSTGDGVMELFIDDDGKRKGKIGDYKITRLLSNDPDKRDEQLRSKGVVNEKEFYMKSLAPAVQLGEKLKRRGQRADPGSRLEFVITEGPSGSTKVCDKIEDAEYASVHAGIIRIDTAYYLNKLAVPMDKVLNIMYGKGQSRRRTLQRRKMDWGCPSVKPRPTMFDRYQHNMIDTLCKRLKTERATIKELQELFNPRIQFLKSNSIYEIEIPSNNTSIISKMETNSKGGMSSNDLELNWSSEMDNRSRDASANNSEPDLEAIIIKFEQTFPDNANIATPFPFPIDILQETTNRHMVKYILQSCVNNPNYLRQLQPVVINWAVTRRNTNDIDWVISEKYDINGGYTHALHLNDLEISEYLLRKGKPSDTTIEFIFHKLLYQTSSDSISIYELYLPFFKRFTTETIRAVLLNNEDISLKILDHFLSQPIVCTNREEVISLCELIMVHKGRISSNVIRTALKNLRNIKFA